MLDLPELWCFLRMQREEKKNIYILRSSHLIMQLFEKKGDKY